MKEIFALINITLIVIIIVQYSKIQKFKKDWSKNRNWYSNDIPRDLKEVFINKLGWWFEKNQINNKDFLEYIDKHPNELEEIVEIILEKTSVSKLYLPKKLEKVVVNNGDVHFPYRIGNTMKIKDLFSGFQGEIKDYAYQFNGDWSEKEFEKILNTNEEFKNRNFCSRFYWLILINNELFLVDASWFRLDPKSWWISSTSMKKVIGNEFSNWIDKGDILFLAKKI